jgi:hypothetical protein
MKGTVVLTDGGTVTIEKRIVLGLFTVTRLTFQDEAPRAVGLLRRLVTAPWSFWKERTDA